MSEELIVRHCSPTLAGLKTGNLFSCKIESDEDLMNEIRKLNRRLARKGLLIIPLKISEKTALIYVYRPTKLKKDLLCNEAVNILKQHGYDFETPEKCIYELIIRLRGEKDFPHEIGLFLGYPPEDVRGFIENNAKSSKCTGVWKVYGDEIEAKKTFERYNRCTKSYIRQLTKGNTIEQLTVVV